MFTTLTVKEGPTETEKEQIETPQENGKESDITSTRSQNKHHNHSNKRKKSSQSSPPKKKIKHQKGPSKPATVIPVEETKSVSSDIPEHKLSKSFTVKLPIDSWECTVRSIDVTPDGRILVVDRRIKLFDKDGNILDTLKIDLCFGPDIVAVTSDEEAVCTVTPDSEIYVINIKDNKLALKGTIRVSPRSWVSDISAHNDTFFIINGTRRCVSIQRIDKLGNICWSRQRDIQVLGQPLLKSQLHARLTSFIEEGKLKLVAVDVTDKRLIKLDGETGEVLMVTKLFDSGIEAPAEISHDGKQFLYVSHPVNKEIYTWNFELTECNMILSDDKGLHGKPSCLKYDAPNERLLVSYGYSLRNVIDIFHSVRKS